MADVTFTSMDQLQAGLDQILQAPKDQGTLRLIVRRPAVGERQVLPEGQLDLTEGLAGDTWRFRGSRRTDDGSSHPDMQLNIMSARVIAMLAAEDRWALAGDQLYIDLDLSSSNLPPGTHLAIGSAIIVVTDQPHTGCGKFVERFGVDAMRFVNSPVGRELRLRGLNARVVQPGVIRAGDTVTKLAIEAQATATELVESGTP
jgi:hypothetical protein